MVTACSNLEGVISRFWSRELLTEETGVLWGNQTGRKEESIAMEDKLVFHVSTAGDTLD